MTALTISRDTKKLAGAGPECDIIRLRAKGGFKYWPGGILLWDGTVCYPGTQTADTVNAVGRIERYLDTTGLADGAAEVEVRAGVYKWNNNNPDGLSTYTTFGASTTLFRVTPKRASLTLNATQQSGASQPWGYSVTGNAYTLLLPTDGASAASGTPNSLQTYFDALPASDSLKLAMTINKATGTTGVITAFSATALSGYLGDTILIAAMQDCYVLDDQTVVATSNGSTRSKAGKVRRIDSDGVYVTMNFPV